MPPENRPQDDEQPTREEWEAYEKLAGSNPLPEKKEWHPHFCVQFLRDWAHSGGGAPEQYVLRIADRLAEDLAEMETKTEGTKMRWECFEDKAYPGTWHVEGVEEKSGDIFVTVFSGPKAELRAKQYAGVQEFVGIP